MWEQAHYPVGCWGGVGGATLPPIPKERRRRLPRERGLAGGSYCLLLHLPARCRLTVGRLGTFFFEPGYYLYCGSALGGLASRLERHLLRGKRLRWHIDYLREVAEVREVWWAQSEEQEECLWAACAAALQGATLPVRRFGSTDCSCPSHLVSFLSKPSQAGLAVALARARERESYLMQTITL